MDLLLGALFIICMENFPKVKAFSFESSFIFRFCSSRQCTLKHKKRPVAKERMFRALFSSLLKPTHYF